MPPEPTDRQNSILLGGLYHWLTPLLIIALAAIVGSLGTMMLNTLTRIEIQMATVTARQAYSQASTVTQQTEINSIIATQANHEHRITVLEQHR